MKLKVFPKIFVITFITILTTILVFFYLFRLFFANYLTYYNEQTFENIVSQIVLETSQKSVDELIQESYFSKAERRFGVTINLSANDDSVYPSIRENPDSKIDGNSSFVGINEDYYSVTHYFQNNNSLYKAEIMYAIQISETAFFTIFQSILPFMILIGFLVSLLISYLYAHKNKKKVKHLNRVMNEMAEFKYPTHQKHLSGDEFKQLENKINIMYQTMMESIQHSQTLAKDKEIFLKGSVHELKTPMMIMSLRLEELLDYDSMDSMQLKIIYDLQTKLNQMNTLIQEVLSITKISSSTSKTNLDPQQIIEQVIKNYEYMIEDAAVKINLICDDSKINMNESDFIKIISNLLGNALRHGANNDIIYISMKNGILKVKNNSNYSIDPSLNLLEPFIQANNVPQEGNGLGLYVISMIVQKYNLHIDLYVSNNEFVVMIQFSNGL